MVSLCVRDKLGVCNRRKQKAGGMLPIRALGRRWLAAPMVANASVPILLQWGFAAALAAAVLRRITLRRRAARLALLGKLASARLSEQTQRMPPLSPSSLARRAATNGSASPSTKTPPRALPWEHELVGVAEVCDRTLGCRGSPGADGLSTAAWLGTLSEDRRQVEEEWLGKLSAEQFRVLRMKGTEPIHSGSYNDLMDAGIYKCAGCDRPLYTAAHKFRSGHGWPAFCDNLPKALVRHGTRKVEIVCAGCDGHIGHIFKSSRYPPPRERRRDPPNRQTVSVVVFNCDSQTLFARDACAQTTSGTASTRRRCASSRPVSRKSHVV